MLAWVFMLFICVGFILICWVLDCEGMGGLFSVAQWQELELQALIYKYMMAGAPVPLELILPLKRSLVSSSPYHHYQHFQTSSEFLCLDSVLIDLFTFT